MQRVTACRHDRKHGACSPTRAFVIGAICRLIGCLLNRHSCLLLSNARFTVTAITVTTIVITSEWRWEHSRNRCPKYRAVDTEYDHTRFGRMCYQR
jgi:hypothetical protein